MKTTKFACLLAATCLALAPTVLALDPPPSGGYPNQNSALGDDALFSLTTGDNNVAIGYQALYDETWGGANTAVGSQALHNATIGGTNCAFGYLTLYQLDTGAFNCAMGAETLGYNTSGFDNTAIGTFAMALNSSGSGNIGIGFHSMPNNSTGDDNIAVGENSLAGNTTGNRQTAVGTVALGSSETAENTGVGAYVMSLNKTGTGNTGCGTYAIMNNPSGSNNTGTGYEVLFSSMGSGNTGNGYQTLYSLVGGDNNVAIGQLAGSALVNGSNNIYIGNGRVRSVRATGQPDESGSIRIGNPRVHTNAYLAGVRDTTEGEGIPVVVGPGGHLGIATSSARYKEGIEPMKEASEAILSLKPVKFRYKKELDPEAIPQFGLVAEQVAKVDPDLVARDESGKPYTVRYEAVNAMLLNEFLKEHRKVENQDKKIAELEAALKEQAAQIEKVNARVDANLAAPRFVSTGE